MTKMDYIRKCILLTKRDKWPTNRLGKEVEIMSLKAKNLKSKMLKWYGHVHRMMEHRWLRETLGRKRQRHN